jgi:hypothetical protein
MKRLLLFPAAITIALLSVLVVSAATTNLTVTPTSPVYDGTNVVGVPGDAAPDFANGSLASNGVAKTDMQFPVASLFGRDVTLGEVAKMSYWTKTGAAHSVDPRDWYLTIYTKPYAGDFSSAAWYGDRIGAEPYFSINLLDPANTWNQWTTDGASNKLRFFESTQGAPGATFGSYTDPDWATLTAGNALSGDPYAGHEILYFSVQTGSAWAAGFTGQVDGLRIELTDGSVATVNFEPDYCQPGYYSANGVTPCSAAPAGTYVDTVGATSATLCPVGTYQPFSAQVSCVLAAPGFFVDSPGAVAQTACPSGTTSQAGADSCTPVSPSPTSTNDCKKGGWQDLVDLAGNHFKNQGDCVSFIVTKAKNTGAGAP